MDASATYRRTIALGMSDPADASPELTGNLVALDEARAAAQLVAAGDLRVFDAATALAGTKTEFTVVGADDPIPAGEGPVFDLAHLDPAAVERGVASREGGAFALANYRHVLHRVFLVSGIVLHIVIDVF